MSGKTFPQAPQLEIAESLSGAEVARFDRASATYEQNKFEVFKWLMVILNQIQVGTRRAGRNHHAFLT